MANSNDHNSNVACVLRLNGLPFEILPEQLTRFLGNGVEISANGVHLIPEYVRNNVLDMRLRPSGDAYIECKTLESLPKGLSLDYQFLGNRFIRVCRATEEEVRSRLLLDDGNEPGLRLTRDHLAAIACQCRHPNKRFVELGFQVFISVFSKLEWNKLDLAIRDYVFNMTISVIQSINMYPTNVYRTMRPLFASIYRLCVVPISGMTEKQTLSILRELHRSFAKNADFESLTHVLPMDDPMALLPVENVPVIDRAPSASSEPVFFSARAMMANDTQNSVENRTVNANVVSNVRAPLTASRIAAFRLDDDNREKRSSSSNRNAPFLGVGRGKAIAPPATAAISTATPDDNAGFATPWQRYPECISGISLDIFFFRN